MTPDEAAHVVAISQLQARYGDVVTRRAWPELVPLFAPDAIVAIDRRSGPPLVLTGPEEVGRFIEGAIEHFEHFEFALLNAVVDVVDGGTATGRVYIWELRQERGTAIWSNAFGVYDDVYVRVGDRWVITARSYRSLARTLLSQAVQRTQVFPFDAPGARPP